MTPEVVRTEPGPPRTAAGGRHLARLSALLGLAAAACLVRFGLLASALIAAGTAAPMPPDDAVPAVAPVETLEPRFDTGLGEAARPVHFSPVEVAPAAGPVAQQPASPKASRAEPATAPPDAPAAVTGVAEGVLSPKALLAVAAELKGRRELVERRERELETREAALDLVEERLAAQIERLEGLRNDLEGVLGRISADEQARLDQLAKVYEAMKAKKAASIFDAMGFDLLLPVVRRMRDSKVSAVIAEMDPAKARLLTAELAKAKALPVLPAPSKPAGG